METSFANIDQYIASFPEPVQHMLREMRKTIQEEAPEATEKISYQMPTFQYNGNLVHFAAFKHHIGFYSISAAMVAVEKELSQYKGTKGSIHFPLDKPLPLDLVRRLVRLRVKENMEKVKK